MLALKTLTALLLAFALAAAIAAPAGAITVSPPGSTYNVAGTLTLTSTLFGNILCTPRGTGTIGAAPLNTAGSGGSVMTPVALAFACPSPAGGTTASTVRGTWTIGWSSVGSTAIGMFTLPDTAITKFVFGGCAFIMPAGEPVTLTGTWTAATSSLTFAAQQLDLSSVGCGLAPGPFLQVRGTLTFTGVTVTTP